MPDRRIRYFLKSKDAKALLGRASDELGFDFRILFKSKVEVEAFESEIGQILLIEGKPALIVTDESIYPTLIFDEYLHFAPKVVVDMGAVPHVCNGANVMVPGVRRYEGKFDKDSIVYVVDEIHGKPIALGQTLFDHEEVKTLDQGVVVRNLFHVGDKAWNLIKELTSR